MGEPGIPTPIERAKRRTLAEWILESVRNDEDMMLDGAIARGAGVDLSYETLSVPMTAKVSVEELAFALAQEIVMLQEDAHERLHKIDGHLVAMMAPGVITVQTEEMRRLYELGVSHGLASVSMVGGTPTVAAIMTGTTEPRRPGQANRPTTANVGDLVFVALPPNCSLHDIPGYGPADLARLVDCAMRVGEHWDNQDGINAAYLDELAEVTRGRRPHPLEG